MAKLYYGGGECSIEGANIRGVEISYSGAIDIEATHGDGFVLMANATKILIFPYNTKNTLNKLFTYNGTLKITRVKAVNMNNELISCNINAVMDYSELLDSNSEDMTTKSEDLKAGYQHGNNVRKTIIKHDVIENLHTSVLKRALYLNGDIYQGYYHQHYSGKIMSGATHTEDSQRLKMRA